MKSLVDFLHSTSAQLSTARFCASTLNRHIITSFTYHLPLNRSRLLIYATMACPCRLMAYISKELKLDVIYLSPMHIAQRIIIGYHLDDNHPTMKDLTKRQREAHRKKLMDNEKLNISRYILGAMKKIRRNGCIVAAYHFG